MSKHTPGKWIVEEAGNENLNYNFRISSEHRVIAQVWAHHNRNSKSEENLTDEANARFIVTACNSHDALLEACKAILDSPGEMRGDGSVNLTILPEIVILLRQAISLAEGKEEGK